MKAIFVSIFVLGASMVQATNHVISVAPGAKLVYDPAEVTAAVGDTLEFQFKGGVCPFL